MTLRLIVSGVRVLPDDVPAGVGGQAQLVETRYAPQARTSGRPSSMLLQKSLEQIDAFPDLVGW